MEKTVHYANCPCCNSMRIAPALDAEDFTVTHEHFSIWQCSDCTVRFTQDIPLEAESGRYYQSENYVSHSDTKQGLINRLYHIIRTRTLAYKRTLVAKYSAVAAGSLLDIGAGTGAFVHFMQQAGWQANGIEPSETARRNALAQYKLQLQPQEAFNLQAAGSFDAITLWHVLEHVHDLHNYLNHCRLLLKNAGKLFIAVPNYTSFDAQAYGAYWAAYDVPRHLYHFSPASMAQLMQLHGFRIVAWHPMWYDSFYISMLSEQYKNGRSNLLAAFFNGLKSNMQARADVKRCSSLIYVIEKSV